MTKRKGPPPYEKFSDIPPARTVAEAMTRRRRFAKLLKSGKYRQAQGGLCRVDSRGVVQGYCCQGVAGDWLIGKWQRFQGVDRLRLVGTKDHWLNPVDVWPPEIRQYFGLGSYATTVTAHMNDTGVPFAEIAEWILNAPVRLFP